MEETRFSTTARRGASRMRASAVTEVPELVLLDAALDEVMLAYDDTRKTERPNDARRSWGHQANTVDLAGLMAIRGGQAIALLIRSGLSIEASGLVRRLGETAQRAAGVADEQSGGDYARTWRLADDKPSKAYVRGVEDFDAARKKWAHLSNLDHANLGPFVEVLASPKETGGVAFPAVPARHAAFDSEHAAGAALDLTRVALAIRVVHRADPSGPLDIFRRLKEQEPSVATRVAAWADTYEEGRRRHEQQRQAQGPAAG